MPPFGLDKKKPGDKGPPAKPVAGKKKFGGKKKGSPFALKSKGKPFGDKTE